MANYPLNQMATESPTRLVESGGARNWPSSKNSAMCGSQLKNMAAKELGLVLKGHRFHGDQTDMILDQSGSAPPSMEGLSDDLGHFESEGQLRSDFAYYCSNVNLNPRLSPPLISRENWHLVRHIGVSGNNWRSTALDDNGKGALHLS
ncbi:hypothetical protein Patl1_19532 [Pistacia atlantica]|uniref:Uncharacterized protein n=1 Tax=Pistacia atlantica TaxID=434234 RepID=A0ACC1C1H4_9ROSI|nr:hypothetical protein Patl1_19532 [Pistacia atlantica]